MCDNVLCRDYFRHLQFSCLRCPSIRMDYVDISKVPVAAVEQSNFSRTANDIDVIF